MERFVSVDYIKRHKNKLKFGRKCFNSLIEGAFEYLNDIKEAHANLEQIYTSAMDFKRKEDFTKKLLIKIFK